MTGSGAPYFRSIEENVPGAGAAVAQDQVIGEAPFTGVVSSVTIISEANVTANATNYRTFRVINKGADGNGTTVVASLALDTPTTDDLADFDEKNVPLSAVAGAVNVTEGDVLAVDETVTGTGLAHSGYKVTVGLNRVTG